MSVPGSTVVFELNARKENFHLLVTITSDDPRMKFLAKVVVLYKGATVEDFVSHDRSTSGPLHGGKGYSFCESMAMKVEFVNSGHWEIDCDQFTIPIVGDLKSYIERGSQVTLIGRDGSVTVSRRLLEMRSEALEMIFNHDSREKQTGIIELKDFDSKTLDAFAHFLMTGKIKDGKETVLGLLLLGDKYDIQFMKSEAERFVKLHFHELDREEAMDIMFRVSRKTVEEGLLRAWRPQ